MNATIYIQKKNEARWNDITDKSAWINAMLEKSPPNSLVEAQKLETTAKVFVPKAAGKIAKDIEEEVVGLALSSQRIEKGICKTHGLPLDSRGKCLQKGCK